MAWIELHQSIWTHRKTFILAAELNLDETYAAAHMARLWTWALDNAQDGNLSGLPNKVIAYGAGWRGDPDVFVQAAINAGWLDKDEEGLWIHDWDDYAGRLIEKKIAERERSRLRRASIKRSSVNSQATSGRPADDQPTTVGTIPNQTIPNQTKPENISSTPPAPSASVENEGQEPVIQPKKAKKKKAEEGYTPEFEQFWAAYPKKVEKQKAFRLWKTRRKEGLTVEDLVNAAKNYAAFCCKQGTEYKFIKYPTTFLGPDKPFEEWIKPNGNFAGDLKPPPPKRTLEHYRESFKDW